MNLQYVLALFGLCLLLGYEPANSSSISIMMSDQREELNEKDKKLLEINEMKDQVKAKSQQIEALVKAIGILAESGEQPNQSIEANKLITNRINNLTTEVENLALKVAYEETLLLNRNIFEKDLKASCKGLPSGIHLISIFGLDHFYAHCKSDGWMTIFRHIDDKIMFHRNWTDYLKGFGRFDAEFFVGLELLHRITNSGTYELLIQVGHEGGSREYALYDNFRIGNRDTKYRLESLGESKGPLVDRLNLNLYQKFSTVDQDNDNDSDHHCAVKYLGPWWYNKCDKQAFNFRYYLVDASTALNDQPFEMFIRPKSNV